MAALNKFIGIGNLTKDPEVKYLPNNDAVANFGIAINSSWKDREGVKHDKVEFISIVAYRKLAEICGEYLHKGSSVYVEGKVQTRQFEKDGQKRYVTEIIVEQMQMLGSKQDNASHSDYAQSGSTKDDYSGDETRAIPKDFMEKVRKAAAGNFDDFDDDIPF